MTTTVTIVAGTNVFKSCTFNRFCRPCYISKLYYFRPVYKSHRFHRSPFSNEVGKFQVLVAYRSAIPHGQYGLRRGKSVKPEIARRIAQQGRSACGVSTYGSTGFERSGLGLSNHCLFPNFPILSHLYTDVGKRIEMSDQILTLKEVAAYLKLAEKTAYRLASESQLPGFKVGASWRFKREDIEVWI